MELQGKRIQFLGDSITAAVGASDEAHAYPAVLGQLTGATVSVDAISGTRIARQQNEDDGGMNFSQRYTRMPDGADVVVVFGGTNDYGHGDAPFGTMADRTVDTYYGACHVLFEGLIRKYPSARIVVMGALQRSNGDQPSTHNGRPLLAYVDAMKEVAGFYSLPFLDLYRTAGIVPDLGVQRETLCPDGLHPNDAGAARVANVLAAFLKTV